MALTRHPVVDTLEQMAAVETRRFTLDQVRTFVDKLRSVTPAADIARQTGLSDTEVIDLGAKLGTWLTHVSGSVDADVVYASRMTQPTLFQDPSSSTVVIPLGFERRVKQRRDIARALATIVVHNPDDTTLSRFLDRLYPSRTSVLAARDVFIVWRFAQVGRLDGLARISSNPAFCKTMASAYNLLETAVNDADSAVSALTDTTTSLDRLADACVSARWMHEARISRLERQIDLVRKDPTAENLLRRSQRALALEVNASPRSWRIASLAELREGQVLRIVQAAGLATEETARREALEIRTKLVELDESNGSDLSKDLDLLVPEGLRARRAGVEPAFWDAIEARVMGDPLWREQLEAALPTT